MDDLRFSPPYSAFGQFEDDVRRRGFAALAPADFMRLTDVDAQGLAALQPAWDALPPDDHLRDGGRYRRRRHSCFVVEQGQLAQVPHRAHWQPVDYNALHGGMHRWFAPMEPADIAQPAWSNLLLGLAKVCDDLKPSARWHVEAHQFRIDTGEGIGRPTPEGAHRDGVDFVAVILVARQGITGGETRVFDCAGPNGQRFTLDAPWSLLFMEDARVIHESTPIRRSDDAVPGHRDTLVLTFRASAFLGED